MTEQLIALLFCGLLVFMLGVYLLFTFRNVLRLIIGVEVVAKGVTLILLAAGVARDGIGFIQALLVTFILVETILAAVMLALAVMVNKIYGSLDVKLLSKLKG
jgi:multisubunit Na+/H+ antiporter MnhC subunit